MPDMFGWCRGLPFGVGRGVGRFVMVAALFAGGRLAEVRTRRCPARPYGLGWGLCIYGEFDPGSGRTLAACLTHASRTVKPFGVDQWRTGE